MPHATESQVQSLIAQGYVCPERIATLPADAVLTRIHWVYISDEEYSLDLDAWIDYADRHFPGLDVEALDMAIGCC
jgi:hypothetical protein